MIEVQRIVDVAVDPADAAAFLLDFETTAIWDPHTVRCRKLGRGPISLGTRFENTQRIAGRETDYRYEVVDFEGGRSIALEGRGGSVAARDSIAVESRPHGARITYTASFDFHGPVRYAQPLLKLMINRIADDGADGMTRTLQAISHARAD